MHQLTFFLFFFFLCFCATQPGKEDSANSEEQGQKQQEEEEVKGEENNDKDNNNDNEEHESIEFTGKSAINSGAQPPIIALATDHYQSPTSWTQTEQLTPFVDAKHTSAFEQHHRRLFELINTEDNGDAEMGEFYHETIGQLVQAGDYRQVGSLPISIWVWFG